MIVWLPIVGFVAGFGAVYWRAVTVPGDYAPYLSLAAIAGLDTIVGGVRAGFEGRFENDVFLSGFVVNTVMSAALAYFGDQIGVPDLYLAAVVTLGGRIFLNLSLIRRYWLNRARAARRGEPGA
ncbi:MAG: small basic family protein [Armatimonadota bacterium]